MKPLQNIRKSIAMNKSLGALKSKGNVFEMSLDEYVELTKSKELAELIATIRQAESHDERRQLKGQLPFRCPHYFRFADNHRAQGSIIPEEFTFQTCIDIDDASQVEPALTRAYILDREKDGRWESHLLHVERSASGKLHLDIRIPVGMTIREAQEAYCKDLGINFDEDCCTPERMIYITDESSQLYTSNDWCARLTDEEIAQRRKAYTDRGLTIDGRGGKSVSTASTASMVTASQTASASTYPETYQNIPYTYIVEELADQMGGIPEHGSRNSFLFSMACHLRHICNEDAQWIKQVLPNYGEAQERVNTTIESACRRNQTKTMSEKLKTAILLARKRVSIENGQDTDSLMRQPQIPERLPAPLRLITSKAPRGYWPAIMNTSMAAFATYTGGVKAEFWDGTLRECTLICGLVAPMSTGKSCIKEPIKHIIRPIEERDRIARQKEREWSDETNTKSANSEKPERPQDICVQIVDSDMTNAAFVQRLDDAERCGNKALLSTMDEMEQL
ncbi:MAG: hypothetical protein K6F02_00470, partial [Prevotella sp.]|nr:hypothetical protein [Prevotella sp.]